VLRSNAVTKAFHPELLHRRSEFVRNSYTIMVPPNYKLDDLLQPETWLHATKLLRFDLIEAIAVDGSFDALLRVETVGSGFAVMRLLHAWYPGAAEAAQSSGGARVGFSPQTGWRVFGEDGAEVARGFDTKADALTALSAHLVVDAQ
jgi:hypothetical protein